MLGRALDALPEHLRARQEPLFVAVARLTDPHTLDAELRKRTDVLDADGADRAEDHDVDRNRVQLSKTLGGRWHLRGDLDPLSGATLRTALCRTGVGSTTRARLSRAWGSRAWANWTWAGRARPSRAWGS